MQALDLYDSATFERGIPHEYFAWLREHEPVHWQPPRQVRSNVANVMGMEQHGYWAVTRHADVIEVSLDQQRFSSERGTVIVADVNPERVAQLRLWMINQDAPRHTKLRKLVNKGFTKRMIDTMEAHDAWWPPTLMPSGLSRRWLAVWIVHEASQRIFRSSAFRISASSRMNAAPVPRGPAARDGLISRVMT